MADTAADLTPQKQRTAAKTYPSPPLRAPAVYAPAPGVFTKEGVGWEAGIIGEALKMAPRMLDRLADPGTFPFLFAGDPVAFEEVLVPFVEAAWACLEVQSGAAVSVWSLAARTALKRSLLVLLSQLATPTLQSEFTLFLSLQGSFPWKTESQSTVFYRRFVAGMLQSGLSSLLAEYRVLACLLAEWAAGWASSHGELAVRLRSDWDEIAHSFELGRQECRIEGILPYRSDPHCDGGSVAIVMLPGGKTLVYKPRALDMEEGFGRVLAWANHAGFTRPFRIVKTLRGQGYGWMEHVAAAPCRSPSEVESFYIRAGGLLCLLMFLQGNDFHRENLIASGDQPVLVDLETLFHPRAFPAIQKQLGPGAEHVGKGSTLLDCLLDISFLPAIDEWGRRVKLDFAALGPPGPVETTFWILGSEQINRDGMSFKAKQFSVPAQQNVPVWRGSKQDAGSHVEALVTGFREMFGLVLEHRGTLLAQGGPLEGFAKAQGRFVARSTNTYGLLLRESLKPELMRAPRLRSLCFERLRRGASAGSACAAVQILQQAELAALERGYVPYFAVDCAAGLTDAVAGRLWQAPLNEVHNRISGASEADLQALLSQIEKSLGSGTQYPATENADREEIQA